MDSDRIARFTLVLMLGLVGAPGVPAQAQKTESSAALPDTPSGRRIGSFLAAFNSGEAAPLERFFREATDPRSPSPRPPAERAVRLQGIYRDVGSLKLRRADLADDRTVAVIVEGARGRLLNFGFRFANEPECWLEGLTFDDAGPEDLEGPVPPMGEAEALADIADTVDQAVAADDFSGTVLVARGGKILLLRAWGLASKEFNVPNRADTKFNLGSINKIFTKVAIGQLLEKGRLSLDDPLGKHIPDYGNKEAAAKVKIRHLVDMQSGIGDFFGPRFDSTPKDAFRRNAAFLPTFADLPLQFEPGTERRYSNGGYIVLGEIVSRVSGRDYYDYVRDNIFRPAGMADTDSYEADEPVANLAEGYTRTWDGTERSNGPRRKNIYTRPARGSAAGGGYSTAEDLLRFANALLADTLLSYPYTEWILTGADPAQTARKDAAPRNRGGWGFAGGAPGINASLEIDRESGSTVVVLSNYDPPAATDITRKVSRLIRAVHK